MRRWVVGSVGGWVGSGGGSGRGWSSVFVALGGYVFRTFVFWTHGYVTALSRPLLQVLLVLTAVYVICCTADVIQGGWVDYFVVVTVVLRSAVCTAVSRWVDRFVAVTM